jgi:hypothetical protein
MKQAKMEMQDIMRLQKQGYSSVESYGDSSVINKEKPLQGVTHQQRQRNTNARDVLNIGAGTRCTGCGLLYFCWAETCSACGKVMDFNLSHRDEVNRL